MKNFAVIGIYVDDIEKAKEFYCDALGFEIENTYNDGCILQMKSKGPTIIVELVDKNFDLRPGAIIRDLKLRRPIYRQIAAYGHFGREDLDLPWERTDKVDLLRQAAGLDK